MQFIHVIENTMWSRATLHIKPACDPPPPSHLYLDSWSPYSPSLSLCQPGGGAEQGQSHTPGIVKGR